METWKKVSRRKKKLFLFIYGMSYLLQKAIWNEERQIKLIRLSFKKKIKLFVIFSCYEGSVSFNS